MIYLEMHESWTKTKSGYLAIQDISKLDFEIRMFAIRIFRFDERGTYYFKDRRAENYQHTNEERLVISLKSVLI